MKVASYICKKSNFDIWQDSEYTSESHGQTNTPQIVQFPIKGFFSEWYQIRRKLKNFPPNLVTFTEEILNGKLHFLCSVIKKSDQ